MTMLYQARVCGGGGGGVGIELFLRLNGLYIH